MKSLRAEKYLSKNISRSKMEALLNGKSKLKRSDLVELLHSACQPPVETKQEDLSLKSSRCELNEDGHTCSV